MRKIPSFLTIKYFLSIIFFVVWMLFFDQRDMFNTLDQKKKLKELEVKKAYYVQEIEKAQQALSDLKNNPAALEKFARERYFMKKDGEDIYIVDPQAETSK